MRRAIIEQTTRAIVESAGASFADHSFRRATRELADITTPLPGTLALHGSAHPTLVACHMAAIMLRGSGGTLVNEPAWRVLASLVSASGGHPGDLWIAVGDDSLAPRILGSLPPRVDWFNVSDEARVALASDSAWAASRAAIGIKSVASGEAYARVRDVFVDPLAESDDDGRAMLTDRVIKFAERLSGALGLTARFAYPIEYADMAEDAIANGIHPWDDCLAELLEGEGVSVAGKAMAAEVREASRRRVSEAAAARADSLGDGRGRLLAGWINVDVETCMPWVNQVAWVLWYDKVKPERERAAEALSAVGEGRAIWSFPTTEHGYAKAPKVVAGVSWAFGAEGVTGIKVDGDAFGLEPSIAAAIANGKASVPRGYSIMPRGWLSRPHQTSIPLGEVEDGGDIVRALAGAGSAGGISHTASKAWLAAMADPRVIAGEIVTADLDSVVRMLNPRLTTIRAGDRRATSQALWELKNICIYNEITGNAPSAFDVAPAVRELQNGDPDGSAEVWIGLSKSFEAAMAQHFAAGSSRGEFLINLSGAFSLDGRNPALLRIYVRLCAMWNAARDPVSGAFGRHRLPQLSLDEFALITNTAPPSTVDAMTAQERKLYQKRLEKNRGKFRSHASQIEAAGLARLEKRGRSDLEFLPPESHLEGWAEARKRGMRRDPAREKVGGVPGKGGGVRGKRWGG